MSKREKRAFERRAFSTFTIKKVDSKARIIEGIASTPTPDRMGDVVEPKGAVFKLPVPLLAQHDSRKPVGMVTWAKATNDGIAFKAKIESIDEPGLLKDRLDLAWQEVVKGLVRGVSIGFMSTEPPELLRNGGFRFHSWEWFELSLVTIPANVEATIDAIKSLSRQQRAAPGHKRIASKPTPTPGATGQRKPTSGAPMSKFTDKIKALDDERNKLKARMSKMLEDAAADEDRELTEDEQTEFDELAGEVRGIDSSLRRYKAAEGDEDEAPARGPKGVVRAVRTDDGGDPARAAATRGRERVEPTVKVHAEKGLGFARMVMCFAGAKGNFLEAMNIAKQRYAADDPVNKALPLVAKAAVAGGTTYDSGWAGALVTPENLVSEFIEYLRPLTIIGKFGTGNIPALRKVPFNVRVPAQTSGGPAAWVGEGKPKPLMKFSFAEFTLRFNKVAAIAVITEELLRHSSPSAELVVRNSLGESVIERLDRDIVDPAISVSGDARPASLTNGAQTYVSLGIDGASVRADLKRLVSYFITNNIPTASIVLVMRQSQALSLSLMRNALGQREFPDITMNGGLLEGMPVIASQWVGAGIVTAVVAQEVYLADDGGVNIDLSREASLQMDTSPTNAVTDGASPPAPVDTELISMFQTNSVAIRAERIITWKKRRTAAAVYQTATGWGNADTSPPQAAI